MTTPAPTPAPRAGYPTPYPDVNTILDLLLSEVRAALGPSFVGMYLYGSLASGDFDPASSDIDFLVVTRDALSPDALARLDTMHGRIAATGLPWTTRLEGSYIPVAAVHAYDPLHNVHPAIGTDRAFGPDSHAADWIVQYHVIRECGVVIAGPPPETLIAPVSPDALRAAMRDVLYGYWAMRLSTPEWFRTREYQSFAVLTMCRVLYTLTHGMVVSKPVAAAWAQGILDERWRTLIGAALQWRADQAFDESGDATETLAFVRYTLDCCHRTADG